MLARLARASIPMLLLGLSAGDARANTPLPAAPQTKPDATATSTKSGIAVTQETVVQPAKSVRLVESGGEVLAVHRWAATHVNTPDGISLIRGGGHAIKNTGASPLQLGSVAGDALGNVFVWYVTEFDGGYQPHLRAIDAANKQAFDLVFYIGEQAGIAADGSGGAYLASHKIHVEAGQLNQTDHTVYRLSATGDTMWQVAAKTADRIFSQSGTATTVTPSAAGVYVGYGIAGADGKSKAVLAHRRAADGTAIFSRKGLVKQASGKPGVPGSAAIEGWVSTIVVGADGTPIAAVEDGSPKRHIVRLDAAGKQTHVFPCTGDILAMGDQLACVVRDDDKVTLVRYGIDNGKLVVAASFTARPLAGSEVTAVASAPSKRLFVAMRADDGDAQVALLGAGGTTLAKHLFTSPPALRELRVAGGKWLGFAAQSETSWRRIAGTYTAATATAAKAIDGGQ